MLLPLILLIATCVLLYFMRYQSTFSPVRMFLYGWLIVLGTSVSGMIDYAQRLAMLPFLLVLGSICAFVLGAYLGRRSLVPADSVFGEPRHDMDRVSLGILCALATVGAVMVVSDLLGGGAGFIANYAADSGKLRNEYWADFATDQTEATPMRSLHFFGVVACLAIATLLPYATRQRRRLLQFASALAAAVVIVDSLLSAARFSMGVLLLCLLVSSSLVYGRQRAFTLRRILIGVAVGFYFFIIFPVQRNPDVARKADTLMSYHGDAHIAKWVTDTGMGWFEVLAYSSGYFSTALDKLNYFVTQTDVMSWYKMGLYNLPQFAEPEWRRTRLDIAELMGEQGWNTNPWSTGIRDLGIDFGVSACLVIGALGYLAQITFDRSVAGRSFIGLITATYVSVSCLIFAFLSPFQIRIIVSGFLLLALIALATTLVDKNSVTRKVRSSCTPQPHAESSSNSIS